MVGKAVTVVDGDDEYREVMIAAGRSLHRKLAQVMYEAERIPKNGRAPKEMGGYPFVQVGDAADYIRKALAEKVISMMPTAVEIVGSSEHPTAKGGTMTTVELRVTWTLTDGESGETATIQSYGVGADTGDKYSGKASTSAMKYALLTGFLLSTGEDPEGSSLPEREATRPARAAPAPTAERGRLEIVSGLAVAGKQNPHDLNFRQGPPEQGPTFGFTVVDEEGHRTGAVAVGPMAVDIWDAIGHDATRLHNSHVTVTGPVEQVPWEKKDPITGQVRKMPAARRLTIERIETVDWTLPVPTPEPVDDDLSDLDFPDRLPLEPEPAA